MELKVGMYVRTKHGIGKIDETEMFMDKYFQFHLDSNKGNIHNVTYNKYWNKVEDIIGEPSYDVIDLIEEGDYVNGNKVTRLMIKMRDEQGVFGLPDHYRTFINPIKIDTIITREQFQAMKYMVKGDTDGRND